MNNIFSAFSKVIVAISSLASIAVSGSTNRIVKQIPAILPVINSNEKSVDRVVDEIKVEQNNIIPDILIYPGSSVSKDEQGVYYLSTSDNPDIVTNWYKTQLQIKNYPVKTFVTTRINGKSENKLAVAASDLSIQIVITGDLTSSSIVIKVT